MPSGEISGRLAYVFDHGAFVALAPAFMVTKTTSLGLSKAISWLTRFDLAAGVGYAF